MQNVDVGHETDVRVPPAPTDCGVDHFPSRQKSADPFSSTATQTVLEGQETEPVKANETSSQDFFCAPLSMVGLLIHAAVGKLGGLGLRFPNRQGLAA